jgi:signal-transduction protein with cAMP-binding, CBS, and nucleotidyltransferase domain
MNDADATRVRAVMGEPPIVVDGLVTVEHAVELMRKHQISSLVIDNRHDDFEYGLLVVTDVASKVIATERSPERTNVYEIMSKPVLTVDADMGLRYAVRLLNHFRVSRALVTERGKMIGMVTLRDMVLRYLGPDED